MLCPLISFFHKDGNRTEYQRKLAVTAYWNSTKLNVYYCAQTNSKELNEKRLSVSNST